MLTDPTRDSSGMRPGRGGQDESHNFGGHDGRSPQSMRRPGIADEFTDLLRPLSETQRRGLIARLSVGYYEGWRPSRAEIADLGAPELGILTVDECLQRERQRKAGSEPVEITESVLSTPPPQPGGQPSPPTGPPPAIGPPPAHHRPTTASVAGRP
jgi:hypothetical protein